MKLQALEIIVETSLSFRNLHRLQKELHRLQSNVVARISLELQLGQSRQNYLEPKVGNKVNKVSSWCVEAPNSFWQPNGASGICGAAAFGAAACGVVAAAGGSVAWLKAPMQEPRDLRVSGLGCTSSTRSMCILRCIYIYTHYLFTYVYTLFSHMGSGFFVFCVGGDGPFLQVFQIAALIV